jgi:hypothetical protein
MGRKRTCAVAICVLGLLGNIGSGDIAGGLVGYWPLDGDAIDASGNGFDGTINGDVIPMQDRLGNPDTAMLFPGESAAHIDLGDPIELNISGAMTLSAWVSLDADNSNNGRIIAKMAGGGSRSWNLNIEGNLDGVANPATFQIAPTGSQILAVNDSQPLPTDEWVHMAGVFRPGEAMEIYVNGELRASVTTGIPVNHFSENGAPVLIGSRNACGNCAWMGAIDEVRVYQRALAAGDIMELYTGDPSKPSSPYPAHEAADVPHDVSLRWTPGDFAVNHDVYLGTRYADVNDADRNNGLGVLRSQGQDVATYGAKPLDFGTRYYWRVDEVNGAPDFAVFKGDVWSFTTEPFSLPISSITATASGSHQGDMAPENTINGSGLDELGQHSTVATDMWLSPAGTQPWIRYEFDKVYKLHEMWVWNSNQMIEAFVGLGSKDVTIETSSDGETWVALESPPQFAQASGSSSYTHNTLVDLSGVSAQYVRLIVNTGWGMIPQYGLSEVRVFYVPTLPRDPQPMDDGATDGLDVVLEWRAGREAGSHEVYLGTSAQTLALVDTISENRYAATDLEYKQTYFWQIIEVNTSEDPAAYAGPVWRFSTPAYLVVDEFEQYNDNCKRVFFAWADGLGHNGGTDIDNCDVPASNGNGGGSIVGNEARPFAEQSIVHSGRQSMPLSYDNSFGPSETTLQLDAMDWTVGGIKFLSLYFRGDSTNTGQLYVKINNVKLPFDGNPAAISLPFWTQWNIDLGAVGADLARVNALTIGIDGADAQGVLYIDDIQLYGQGLQALGPQDPGTDHLVAYYAMENSAQDGSDNGRNGTVEGSPAWVSPGWDGSGACMQFGGDNDRITVESFDVTGSGITMAAWIKPILFLNDARMLSKAEGSGTVDHYWAMVLSGSGENFLQFRLRTDVGATTSRTSAGNALQADEWAHIAVTWDAGDPFMRQFKNGQEIDSLSKAGNAVATGSGVKIGIGNQSVSAGPVPADMTRPFEGLMDELYIYSRGLSAAELLHLASGL